MVAEEGESMGYSVFFEGRFVIEPSLTPEQLNTLTVFARTGRTPRAPSGAAPPQLAGETFVMHVEQAAHDDSAAPAELNERVEGQPSRFCCWRPTPDGRALEWDGCEKFSAYEAWANFLVETFLAPWGRRLDGRVSWQGEDGATGVLVAANSVVTDEPDAPDTGVDDDVRALLVAVRGTDAQMRAMAVHDLTCAADASEDLQRETVTALCEALKDAELSKRALESLGELGETAAKAVPAVMPLLEHPDPQVRYWATFAIGRMGTAAQAAIPLLRKLTTDADYGPRHGAIDALKRIEAETSGD